MLVVKIRHVGIELQLSLFDVQVAVALSATGIRGFGHLGLSLMLKMARTAGRGERLLRVVNGSVVAGETGLSSTAALKLAPRT